MSKQLLHTPEGVRDIYSGEYAERLFLQNRIHTAFARYGYKDIKTPTFEFFDIFNKERGSVASKNMFKFFDKQGNTLVLRPDMTPSIARCAAKYFENEEGQIRLCYIGDTFINNTRYQGRLMETTQAGCELINVNSIEADAEIISLLIYSILESGLTDFQVEIGHIGFFEGLAMEAGLNEDAKKEMRQIILDKNIFRVAEMLKEENVSDEVKESFFSLPQLFGGVEILDKAKNITTNKAALEAIEYLEKLYELLKVYGFEKYVTFDLGMLSELDYYTGVIFKAYTYDVGEPIANGGRYDKLIEQFGKDKDSIGFSITVDLLHQAINRQKIDIAIDKDNTLVLFCPKCVEKAIKLSQKLRNEGKTVTMLPIDSVYDESLYTCVIKAGEADICD